MICFFINVGHAAIFTIIFETSQSEPSIHSDDHVVDQSEVRADNRQQQIYLQTRIIMANGQYLLGYVNRKSGRVDCFIRLFSSEPRVV